MNEKKPEPKQATEAKNRSHAWRGTWDRPMKIDEDSLDPFTAARMTDHNVRGSDDETPAERVPATHEKEDGI